MKLSVVCFALSGLLASGGLLAGEVVATGQGLEFRESFPYSGNHAATIANGSASTVWWDEASWDVRGDSNYISVTPQDATVSNRFHVDVHRSPSTDPRDGRLDNTVLAPGGDGGPGVGVMHLDYQDILDARLRNPLLISPARPARVTFYASGFNTSGHWWEVAITPASRIIGGEHSAVPGQGEAGLLEPFGNGNRQPGPGHSPAEDAVNLVMFGASDVPCSTGWQVRAAVTRSLGGVTTQYVNPVASMDELMPSDPGLAETLIHWQLEFRHDGVVLSADPDEDGQWTLVEQWALQIPWSEVHLHLLGVAYQADHHPQEPCYLGHMRELRWREVRAAPVKYAATDVFPKNANLDHVPTRTHWRAYDLRDIQRFGAPIAGAPQPNTAGFGTDHRGRWCRDGGYPCFGNDTAVSLQVEVPPRAGYVPASARFVYDTKDPSQRSPGAALRVNGTAVGTLPTHASVPGAAPLDWVRRDLAFAPALLAPTTQVQLQLDPGMYLDRMELEIGYAAATMPGALFSNGFEGQALATLRAKRGATFPLPAALPGTGRASPGTAHCGQP